MLTFRRLPLLVLMAWAAAACSLLAPKFVKPSLSVVSIRMTGGNLLQQNFLVTFDIQNPNDRALPVKGLHAELDVAGERFATGVSERAFVVPALGDIRFDMTINANMALALLQLTQRGDGHGDAIAYEVTGAASIDLPFLSDLPFHQKGSFSLRDSR